MGSGSCRIDLTVLLLLFWTPYLLGCGVLFCGFGVGGSPPFRPLPGPTHFLCLAKESKQRKARPRWRPPSLNFCRGEGKEANSLRSNSLLPFSSPQQKFKAPSRAGYGHTVGASVLALWISRSGVFHVKHKRLSKRCMFHVKHERRGNFVSIAASSNCGVAARLIIPLLQIFDASMRGGSHAVSN